MTKIPKREQKRLVELFETLVSRDVAGQSQSASGSALVRLHWYVLTVSPMCEKAVAKRLLRLVPGVATYIPIATRRQRRDSVAQAVEWLPMPRYLFVGFETAPPWLFVRDVMGVQGVLGVDNVPLEIDASVVGELMWRCETRQIAPPPMPMIQKGMQVVARRGTMTGFEGVVTKVHKQTDLVEVMFGMIGNARPITMRLDDVVAALYA